MTETIELTKPRTNGAHQDSELVEIAPPNLKVASFELVGTAPYVQLQFSQKARKTMRNTQEEGSTARGRKKRQARDFDDDYKQSMHLSEQGWHGIPASAFRAAASNMDWCCLGEIDGTLNLFSERDDAFLEFHRNRISREGLN